MEAALRCRVLCDCVDRSLLWTLSPAGAIKGQNLGSGLQGPPGGEKPEECPQPAWRSRWWQPSWPWQAQGGGEREEVKGRPACEATITFQSDCGPRLNMRWKSLALKNGYFYIPFPKFQGAEIQFKTKRNPKRDRGKKYPTMKIILSFNISNAYLGAPPRPTEPTAGLEPHIFNMHPADSCIPLLLIVGTVPATRPGAEDAGCSDTGKFPALWRRFSQKATTQHPSSQWGLGRASESSSWEGLGLRLHPQKQHFLQASEEEGRGSGLQVWVARGP